MRYPTWTIGFGLLLWPAVLDAASSLSYRIPAVNDPADPILVFLDLTSDRDHIAAVGSRLTYDPARVSLQAVAAGAGAPASWSFVFQDTGTAGQVDLVLTDQTPAAATVSFPAALEVVKLTFSRLATDCAPSPFDFSAAAPGPGAPAAAFPVNHYVIYVGVDIIVEAAATSPAAGPVTADQRFIRGNVNTRASHVLDLGDVVDLVAMLFGGFVPGFDCQAAFDVNNDGAHNITDVVALVQGVFGVLGYAIPPPSTTPGLVTVDGGTIPSVLGCNQGEQCL